MRQAVNDSGHVCRYSRRQSRSAGRRCAAVVAAN